MTLNEILFTLKEKLKDNSDDEKYPLRYLESLVNTKRAFYIKKELDDIRTNIDSTLKQTICAPLEYTDASDCCGNLKTCSILRTVNPIPSVFTARYNSGIQLVGPMDRSTRAFSYISAERVGYIEGAPYAKGVYWFYHTDGRIYIVSKNKSINLLKQIRVIAIFEDVAELKEYTNCNTTDTCYTYDDDYPIQSYLIDLIINEIVNELLNIDQGSVRDNVNDADEKA